MANITKDQVKEWLGQQSVLEIAGLVKELEEEWGVSAAAPVAVAAVAGGGDTSSASVQEKTEFDIILTDSGSNKINVIKEVRAITGLGLKEAKELVDSAPKSVKDGASKEEAKDIKQKLEAAGAKVEIK